MRDLRDHQPIAGCTNTGLLKLLALVFMFIDHAGKMCFPAVQEMRMLGRIAFPLYAWCMAVGASHTRSMPRYLLRLLLIGLISQPLYMAALNHPLTDYNIFLTLLVGLCGVWGLKARRWLSQWWAPMLALLAAQLLGVDYGWKGVLLIMMLYAVRGSRAGIACVMVAFCMYWGNGSLGVSSVFGLSLAPLQKPPFLALFSPWLKLQALAVLALPLMLMPLKGNLKTPRWLGYAIYPLHLLLLIALEYHMGVNVRWDRVVQGGEQLLHLLTGGAA